MASQFDPSRASSAVHRISRWAANYPEKHKFWRAYSNIARQLPGRIRYEGFLRAVAGAASDAQKAPDSDRDGYLAGLSDIAYLLNNWHETHFKQGERLFSEEADLNSIWQFVHQLIISDMSQSIPRDQRQLCFIQHETLEILSWMKLLSDPYRPKGNQNKHDEGEPDEAETEEEAQ